MQKNLFIFSLIALLSLFSKEVQSQGGPFGCVTDAYLFQANDIFEVDLASGNALLAKENIIAGNINATAFNPSDGYIWGSTSSPTKHVIQIGKDFSYTTHSIPQMASGSYVGAIDSNGIYYAKAGGSVYHKINLNSNSVSYLQHLGTDTLSKGLNIHDWAFNPIDGQLYTVERGSNKLVRINSGTGQVSEIGVVPILSGNNYTYGAVYFDLAGNLYVSSNQTGTIYITYSTQTLSSGSSISSNIFAYGPSSSLNDGARCPTAPVPMEDCNNGIDDDADGLTDCSDPSCSGVSGCPTLPASSGSSSGLESNNRLGDKIQIRNYRRKREGYTFKAEFANQLEEMLVSLDAESNEILKSFIPVGALEGTVVLESTPSDLVAITNAEEIFSADFMRDGTRIAGILATQTQGAAYEHSKTICDRLAGSSIVSVSTLQVKEHDFPRTLIKHQSGEQEFTLSFAVRMSNNKWVLESHWALDSYTKNENYFNFQLWSQSIDELLILTESLIEKLESGRPIEEFILSSPPSVYVAKGEYIKSGIKLNVMNTGSSETLLVAANVRATETESEEFFTSSHPLQKGMNSIELELGPYFDAGLNFIGEQGGIADNLYISDGTWSIEVCQQGFVNDYKVRQSESLSNEDAGSYILERDLMLDAWTPEPVTIFRTLNPKFVPVNLKDFNTLAFSAKGLGTIDIRLVCSNIISWEEQPKLSIELHENVESYSCNIAQFIQDSQVNIKHELEDVLMVHFEIRPKSDNTVRLHLSNVKFTQTEEISFSQTQEDRIIRFSPNPFISNTRAWVFSKEAGKGRLNIYGITGKLVSVRPLVFWGGMNDVQVSRNGLKAGNYITCFELPGGRRAWGRVTVDL